MQPIKRHNMNESVIYSRGVQFTPFYSQSTGMSVSCGTQTRRRGHPSPPGGRIAIAVPERYIPSEVHSEIVKRAAIVIQAEFRRHLARARVAVVRAARAEAEAEAAAAAAVAADYEAKLTAIERERRMHPRTAADFALLESELAAWRAAEETRAALCARNPEELKQRKEDLVTHSAAARRALSGLRAAAAVLGRVDTVHARLHAMAAPRPVPAEQGVVLVTEPNQSRAQQLKALYEDLEVTGGVLSVEADDEHAIIAEISARRAQERQGAQPTRLEVLAALRVVARERDCPLSRDILALTDRESDYIARERPRAALIGLRRRIMAAAEKLVFAPEFNPSAARFLLAKTPEAVPHLARPEIEPIEITGWREALRLARAGVQPDE